MKRIVLALVLVAAAALPAVAAGTLGVSGSIGVGANKEFMDAGYTAADVSVSLSLSVLPIQMGDLSAGVTLRATGGSTIINDTTTAEWYALTPMLTIIFLDSAPMFISVGYGPHAYSALPELYIYSPAVLLGFISGSGTMEIGMIGPSIFVGFGLLL